MRMYAFLLAGAAVIAAPQLSSAMPMGSAGAIETAAAATIASIEKTQYYYWPYAYYAPYYGYYRPYAYTYYPTYGYYSYPGCWPGQCVYYTW